MSRLAAFALAITLIVVPANASACSVAVMRDLFRCEATTQTVLDIEAAIALTQADEDVIPQSAAQDIARDVRGELFGLDASDAEYVRVNETRVTAHFDGAAIAVLLGPAVIEASTLDGFDQVLTETSATGARP